MSTSTRDVLVSLVALSWLAAGCSDSSKKIDLGGGCLLNSDCNSPLSCTFGKCHTACVATRDCPLGQACVQTPGGGVCQFPADSDCQSSGGVCPVGLVCATDQRCRKGCQTAAECLAGQACSTSGTCADSQDLDGNGQIIESGVSVVCATSAECNSSLTCAMNRCHYPCQNTNLCPSGQSCVNTGSGPVCQLPVEALCDGSVPCPGGLVCAVDYRCRAPCGSASDCTTGQKCAGGVCADSGDLDPSGQIPPKSPPVISRDAGAPDAPVADIPVVSPADAALEVSSAEAGLPDVREAATGEAGVGRDSAGGADGRAVDGSVGAGGRGGAGGASSRGGVTGAGGSKATGGTVATGGTPAAGGAGTGGSTTDAGPGGGSDIPTGCSVPSTATRYFCDDFESGTTTWTLSGQDWGPTTATARSDGTSLTESPNGNYLNGENASATMTGNIDLTGAETPVLVFWHKLALDGADTCYACYTYDTAFVEASSDGGITWTKLTQFQSGNNTSTWSRQVFSLASYVQKHLKIRFRLWDNTHGDSYTANGWTIDDVEVGEIDTTTSPPVDSGGCGAATTTRYFCDAFESGLDNWIVSSKDWNTTTSVAAVSGSHSITDSPDASYLNDADSAVTLLGSVDLSLAVAPVLTFWHKLALNGADTCYACYTYDTAYVEVSVDAGVTWAKLSQFQSGNSTSTWAQQIFDLKSYLGGHVKIRFRLWDNASGTANVADGWYIDDVEIRENL